ncbi:IS3 family transposase [Bacillus sp. FSL R12-0069]|uniref:IS3 family transposase n=1 Tax=Bacillus sp. FSL R12-0069 TaxID=2975342 RepID=UPI004046CD77
MIAKKQLIPAIKTYIYHYNYKRFPQRPNHRTPIEYRVLMSASYSFLQFSI